MRLITRKSPAEIAHMRSAGRIVAEVLALVEMELKPGVSTAELDALAARHIRDSGGVPSFVGYLASSGTYNPRDPRSYPAATCISVRGGWWNASRCTAYSKSDQASAPPT